MDSNEVGENYALSDRSCQGTDSRGGGCTRWWGKGGGQQGAWVFPAERIHSGESDFDPPRFKPLRGRPSAVPSPTITFDV